MRLLSLSPYAVKANIVSWPCKKYVVSDDTMGRNDMSLLILPQKPREKIYNTDHILAICGHTVVPPPPYMCDLHPAELTLRQKCRDLHGSVR